MDEGGFRVFWDQDRNDRFGVWLDQLRTFHTIALNSHAHAVHG